MKSRVLALILIFSLGIFYTPVQADNINPPKIIDLVQVTRGPYKPGDLVTFRIIYTGGNPGLDNVKMIFANGCDNKFTLSWYESEGVTEKHGNGFVSSVIPACPPGFIYPTYVAIRDKTQLEDSKVLEKSTSLQIEVIDYIYKPLQRGEIAPDVLQTHTLDLSMIPTNPKVGDSYLLPAVTSVGMPVYYRTDRSSPCSITQEQFGPTQLPGGTLKILRNGDCSFTVQSHNGSEILQKPTFAGPSINARGTLNSLQSTIVTVSYVVKVDAQSDVKKKITISCVKGKTVKQVTAVNPKCPKGFKKK